MEESKARALRLRLTQERATGRGRGRRAFTDGLRRDVVEFFRAERARGTSPDRLVEGLGLSRPTLYQWCSTGKGQTAFRQMAIVRKAPLDCGNGAREGGPTRAFVTGPYGLAIHGLGVNELAELFRRLGC